MAKSGVRIVIKQKGVRALLTSPEVQANLDDRAARIAAEAGEGFIVRRRDRRVRRYASQVRTSDDASRQAQAESNALLRALDAGRG